ncbi:hypothetical protein HOB87_09335 [Candidatus Woesearchaeota archaeon]|jgi:hypothetical protein|nr:hypothetical protein [Candidatus Woesearchaeota archaeon]MBT7786567.1 hypothetical protein [Candidatus Woesearchaeota archaeon]
MNKKLIGSLCAITLSALGILYCDKENIDYNLPKLEKPKFIESQQTFTPELNRNEMKLENIVNNVPKTDNPINISSNLSKNINYAFNSFHGDVDIEYISWLILELLNQKEINKIYSISKETPAIGEYYSKDHYKTPIEKAGEMDCIFGENHLILDYQNERYGFSIEKGSSLEMKILNEEEICTSDKYVPSILEKTGLINTYYIFEIVSLNDPFTFSDKVTCESFSINFDKSASRMYISLTPYIYSNVEGDIPIVEFEDFNRNNHFSERDLKFNRHGNIDYDTTSRIILGGTLGNEEYFNINYAAWENENKIEGKENNEGLPMTRSLINYLFN